MNNDDIKCRIKQLRKELKLTQAQMANDFNMTRSAISALETGLNQLTDRLARDICEKYQVSEDWLKNGIGPMFRPKPKIENELAHQFGRLLSGEDEFTKKLFLAYMSLTDEQKSSVENFIRNLISDNPEKHKEKEQ